MIRFCRTLIGESSNRLGCSQDGLQGACPTFANVIGTQSISDRLLLVARGARCVGERHTSLILNISGGQYSLQYINFGRQLDVKGGVS